MKTFYQHLTEHILAKYSVGLPGKIDYGLTPDASQSYGFNELIINDTLIWRKNFYAPKRFHRILPSKHPWMLELTFEELINRAFKNQRVLNTKINSEFTVNKVFCPNNRLIEQLTFHSKGVYSYIIPINNIQVLPQENILPQPKKFTLSDWIQ